MGSNIWKLIEPLGLLTAFSFGFALLNYVMKFAHKQWISKLGPEYAKQVGLYRQVMKLVIQYHKLAGFVAVLGLSAHFGIAFSLGLIRLSGLISAGLLIAVFLLGVYGAFIKKKSKGLWIILHRLVAASLVISIFIHAVL